MVNIVRFLASSNFKPGHAFIISKMNEKTGQIYQKCLIIIQLQYFLVVPEFRL